MGNDIGEGFYRLAVCLVAFTFGVEVFKQNFFEHVLHVIMAVYFIGVGVQVNFSQGSFEYLRGCGIVLVGGDNAFAAILCLPCAILPCLPSFPPAE